LDTSISDKLVFYRALIFMSDSYQEKFGKDFKWRIQENRISCW